MTLPEVLSHLQLGQKSEAELHPDFDLPLPGELPVPVLAESAAERKPEERAELRGEARESTTTAGPTLPASSKKEPDSRGGQPPLLSLQHVFSEVQRRFLGCVLFGLFVFTSCSKKAEPEPWSVICDNAGHYTFVDRDGSPWPLEEWATFEEARDYGQRIKEITESLQAAKDEAQPKANLIRSRKWQACSK